MYVKKNVCLIWEATVKEKYLIYQVRDLVRKGIPHHFRGMAWQVVIIMMLMVINNVHNGDDDDKHGDHALQ